MIMLEGAKATTKMIDALRTGATAMKAMQKAMCVVQCYSVVLRLLCLNIMPWLIYSVYSTIDYDL